MHQGEVIYLYEHLQYRTGSSQDPPKGKKGGFLNRLCDNYTVFLKHVSEKRMFSFTTHKYPYWLYITSQYIDTVRIVDKYNALLINMTI